MLQNILIIIGICSIGLVPVGLLMIPDLIHHIKHWRRQRALAKLTRFNDKEIGNYFRDKNKPN